MSRIIKFRAYDTKEKKWLLGYEYPNLGGFSMFGEVMMMGEYASLLSSYFPDRLEDIDLMQFTGLLDKNGKEIYEGDIVKTEDFTGYIWYRSPDFVIRQDIGSNNEHTYLDFFREREVIGNIYENPTS